MIGFSVKGGLIEGIELTVKPGIVVSTGLNEVAKSISARVRDALRVVFEPIGVMMK